MWKHLKFFVALAGTSTQDQTYLKSHRQVCRMSDVFHLTSSYPFLPLYPCTTLHHRCSCSCVYQNTKRVSHTYMHSPTHRATPTKKSPSFTSVPMINISHFHLITLPSATLENKVKVCMHEMCTSSPYTFFKYQWKCGYCQVHEFVWIFHWNIWPQK